MQGKLYPVPVTTKCFSKFHGMLFRGSSLLFKAYSERIRFNTSLPSFYSKVSVVKDSRLTYSLKISCIPNSCRLNLDDMLRGKEKTHVHRNKDSEPARSELAPLQAALRSKIFWPLAQKALHYTAYIANKKSAGATEKHRFKPNVAYDFKQQRNYGTVGDFEQEQSSLTISSAASDETS